MAIIVLSLGILAAFWGRNAWPIYRADDRDSYGFEHARLSLSRSVDPQPKGWLQWASDEGNGVRGHVPSYPQEPEPQDDDGGVDVER